MSCLEVERERIRPQSSGEVRSMIHERDIAGFFEPPQSLAQYLICHFEFETILEPKHAVAQLCSEQSTAQWKRAGVNEDLRPQFGAKALDFEVISESPTPLYAFTKDKASVYRRMKARIAHPIINFGPRIANILSAMAGEGSFYCPGITTIRWMDVEFPDALLNEFEGPRFGLEGLRENFKVHDRPFFIGVVKPNLGLSPHTFAELAFESWMGGLDIAKDDEMLADAPYSSTVDRMSAAGKLKARAENETGRPKGLLANVTDEISRMPELCQRAEKAGANLVMVNSFFTGLGTLRYVRDQAQSPVMSHFTGMALYDRIPMYGIDGVVLIKLQRLAGADLIVMAGFGERMHATDEAVIKNVQACLAPMGKIRAALPVPGGSDWAGTLPLVHQKLGHIDFGFIAGRGIYGHPSGPRSGAQSLHAAWEAICTGESLKEKSLSSIPLKEALDSFDAP